MFALFVEMEAKPAFTAELEECLHLLVEHARHEPGTLHYALHRHQDQPGLFLLYELYKDRGAWDEHMRFEPVAALLKRIEALLTAPPRIAAGELVHNKTELHSC
jgi:quinol monooxygenase YgiN